MGDMLILPRKITEDLKVLWLREGCRTSPNSYGEKLDEFIGGPLLDLDPYLAAKAKGERRQGWEDRVRRALCEKENASDNGIHIKNGKSTLATVLCAYYFRYSNKYYGTQFQWRLRGDWKQFFLIPGISEDDFRIQNSLEANSDKEYLKGISKVLNYEHRQNHQTPIAGLLTFAELMILQNDAILKTVLPDIHWNLIFGRVEAGKAICRALRKYVNNKLDVVAFFIFYPITGECTQKLNAGEIHHSREFSLSDLCELDSAEAIYISYVYGNDLKSKAALLDYIIFEVKNTLDTYSNIQTVFVNKGTDAARNAILKNKFTPVADGVNLHKKSRASIFSFTPFIEYVSNIPSRYRGQILELLEACDNDFVPSLSSRNSTTTKSLKGVAKSSLLKYLQGVLEQPAILAYTEDYSRVIGILSFKTSGVPIDVEHHKNVLYRTTLCVYKEYRKLGYGRMLAEKLETVAKHEIKATAMLTRTWSTNLASLNLLKSVGFKVYREILNDRGNGIHTIYLLKDLA